VSKENLLPCGHTHLRQVEKKGDAYLLRCVTCNRPYAWTPESNLIEVEAVFKLDDLKDGESSGEVCRR
jgi:hypothetical protein